MKRSICLLAVLLLVGCTGSPTEEPKRAVAVASAPPPAGDAEAEIRPELAKLAPADRKLAEAQKWCAISTDSRLGSMDKPYKIMLKGEPVFLCCAGCKKRAEANPEQTLATVAALKEKAAKAP